MGGYARAGPVVWGGWGLPVWGGGTRARRVGSIAIGHVLKPDGRHVEDKGVRRCQPECLGCLHLKPRPDMIEAARFAQGLISGGASFRGVAKALDGAGLALNPGKPWHYVQVQRLVVTMAPYLEAL